MKMIDVSFEVHTVGELWKDGWGVHCIDTPTVEIDNVSNITVSYNDSSVVIFHLSC